MSETPPYAAPTYPPGWYPAEGGHLRWWDGAAWGPYAPGPPAPVGTEEERGKGVATLAHLGLFAGGFILPLVLYLIEKDKPNRNRYVCHHAREALNFQLTFLIVYLSAFVIGFGSVIFGGFLASSSSAGRAAFPIAFVVIWCGVMLAMLANVVCSVIGAWKAYHGTWWRNPLAIRLVGRNEDWQRA